MKASTKIAMGLTGIALIALGTICLCNPGATLISIAWIIGILVLVSGFSTLAVWSRTRTFLPAGNILLSAVLEILLGLMFLNHNLVVATVLPIIFACWLVAEGLILAIRSFDFRQVGFSPWWILCLLGIAAAWLGFSGLKYPAEVGAPLVSTLAGIGIITLGVINLSAIFCINRFERRRYRWVDWKPEDNDIDEQ